VDLLYGVFGDHPYRSSDRRVHRASFSLYGRRYRRIAERHLRQRSGTDHCDGRAESISDRDGTKKQMDLSMGVALGSCIQIALFVAPVLVLASYLVAPHPLELSFGRAELGAMFLAILIGAMVSGDGRSNWYKGVQLTTVYIILAFLFYFMPETVP
jgi:sodium/calcium exchanger protein